jgi:hypothetical protein
VVIDLHHAQDSSGDEDHEVDIAEEEVDQFSDDDTKVQEPQEPPTVLSYKAPPQFSHMNIPQGSPLRDDPPVAKCVKKSLIDSEQLIQTTAENVSHTQKKPSEKEIAQYYQNMILSQSTGVVRAFGDQPFQNSLVGDEMNKNNNGLHYIHSNDHISGALPSEPISKSSNSLRQFTIAPLSKLGSSGETSSSALSFKADPVNRETPVGTPSNFNQFLKSSGSNIETRTQQKLWLQRENSLLDISQVSNAMNPQVRREFERVSREFMNVRRFVNPLINAVKRASLESSQQQPKILEDHSKALKTLKSDEIQAKLMKLWIQGEKLSKSRTQSSTLPSYQQHQQQQQRPTIHSPSGMNGYGPSLRSPVAPTTRAVDRANNTPDQNKPRIDLAAMRMPEEVQKIA